MNSATERVGNFLAHYASQYYDPVKAREYYLRNRELKGRQSTSELKTEAKKEAWDYTKGQIKIAEKADLTTAAETRTEFVEQLREAAQQRREEIGEKLKVLLQAISDRRAAAAEDISDKKTLDMADLSDRQKALVEKIRADSKRQIDALPPIPKGISPAKKARLTAERAEDIAKIRGETEGILTEVANQVGEARDALTTEASSKRVAISDAAKTEKASERETANAEREAVRVQLTATVDKARSDYEARKEQIKADYEATAQREYDAIKANV